jgi:hypothetical protein
MDDAFDAVAESWDVEVDEKAEMEASSFEIGDDLGDMDGGQRINGFQFHNQSAVHQNVKPSFADIGFMREGERQ